MKQKEKLVTDLKSKARYFKDHEEQHRISQRLLLMIYLTAGVCNVIAGGILSVLTGSNSLMDDATGRNYLEFTMALLVMVITSVLSFTRLENRIAKHDTAADQYRDLGDEIDTLLLTEDDVEVLINEEKVFLEKSKFVNSYAPMPSLCCKKR